jgi:hypothetical protein
MRFLFFLFAWNAFAGEAMVTVLEAPIFKEESQDSIIVQYVRMGEKIYIDNRDLRSETEEGLPEKIPGSETTFPAISKKVFYKTLDKNGTDAYILGEHIKIIYNDFREFSDKLPEKDPTDYRITEPISEKYPFIQLNQPMINLAFGIGPQRKLSYPYSEDIIYEQYLIRTSLGINYFYPKLKDQSFRWGINGAFYNGNRRFMLQNETKSYEQEGLLSLGPQLWFDAVKGEKFEVSYILGATLDYNRTLITQQPLNGNQGERAFQGIGVTPMASVYLSGLELLWGVDLQFILEAQLILPQTLKPTDGTPDTGSWNSSNQDYITIPFGGQINFYLGFCAKL